jgi:hypothetical protein
MRAYLACGVVLACFTGCFIDTAADNPPGDDGPGPGPGACATEPTVTIDTGATIDHEAGVDAGYYAEYDGAGAWHFEWTCDTDVSAEGCTFSGSIVAQTPDGGVNASCYQCESDDVLTTTPGDTTTEIDFNTDTTSGIDGVDFTSVPGASVEINFQINDLYQNDLVFLPSGGVTTNPVCMPLDLSPSTP